MSVLAGLKHDRHFESIEKASEAIISHARDRCGSRPWSICEVGLADTDFQWLLAWAEALHREQLRLSLSYSTRRPKIGLLLLTLATEVCRRDSQERGIWQVFSNVSWGEKVRSLLFVENGYPRNDVRECFEDACRCFGLRHAFDLTEQHPWYLTNKLQFGFTLNGAKSQLAMRMLGNPHAAIRELTAGEFASESFIELWNTLRAFRELKINANQAKQTIERSCWVRTEWADELLTAARK